MEGSSRRSQEPESRSQEACRHDYAIVVLSSDFSHCLCGTYDFRFSRKADASAEQTYVAAALSRTRTTIA